MQGYRHVPLWWALGTSAEALVLGGECFHTQPCPSPFLPSGEILEGSLREASFLSALPSAVCAVCLGCWEALSVCHPNVFVFRCWRNDLGSYLQRSWRLAAAHLHEFNSACSTRAMRRLFSVVCRYLLLQVSIKRVLLLVKFWISKDMLLRLHYSSFVLNVCIGNRLVWLSVRFLHLVFWDRISLCGLGSPRTCCVDQSGLELGIFFLPPQYLAGFHFWDRISLCRPGWPRILNIA